MTKCAIATVACAVPAQDEAIEPNHESFSESIALPSTDFGRGGSPNRPHQSSTHLVASAFLRLFNFRSLDANSVIVRFNSAAEFARVDLSELRSE